MAAGSARVVLVVMAMFSVWWRGGSGQLEPWRTRLTPEIAPVCSQCYKGLCNVDDPEPLVDMLFPNLFTTLKAAGYDNCEVLFDEMINEDAEARVSCPWRPEEALTRMRRALTRMQAGCDKWWHKSDLDECCETCRYRRLPLVVPTANGSLAFAVHLHWRSPRMFQTFHFGYCGTKRLCSGKCREIFVQHKVLVSNTWVTSDQELLSGPLWFESINLPAYCYCS